MTNPSIKSSFNLSGAGLLAGPVVAAAIFMLLPHNYVDADGAELVLSTQARAVAAIAALMAVWWMTEAISVYATALVPLAVFPLANISTISETAVSYGHEIIFLFMGGFIVALALERWGLHRRLALNVLATVGPKPQAIVGAFMLVSALLSMWVTNTATTIMLLPVAVSVIAMLPERNTVNGDSFAICLLLGIAYASSIGGMGTIIGTAPNIFVVSFIREQLGRNIGFFEWMTFAIPLVVLFLPIAWFALTRFIYPVSTREIAGATAVLQNERDKLPLWSNGERATLVVFGLTALAWITRPLLNKLELGGIQPLAGLTDPGIAILAAVILFVTPVSWRKRVFLMNWETAIKLPWGLLVLFGGGLALASGLVSTGFSAYLGALAAGLENWPVWMIVMTVTAAVVFLTELTSNTATTATLVPILFAVAIGIGLPPLMLVLPAAFAASCAFMLPVATPPNAVVFGSGLIRLGQMSRAGFWLNLIAIGLITIATYAILIPILGMDL